MTATSIRTAARRAVRVPISAKLLPAAGELFEHAVTITISTSGLCCKGVLKKGASGPAVGARLAIQLTLPQQTEPLHATGQVLWTDAEHVDDTGAPALGIGLEFVEVGPPLRQAVTQFLGSSRPQILAVDDEIFILTFVKDVLDADYHVLTAASGQLALDTLAVHEVAVLMVDQRMPGMTGGQLLEEVNRRYPRRPMTKLVLSAHADRELILAAVNQGKIFSYIEKPVDLTVLQAAMAAAVEAYDLAADNEALRAELMSANAHLLSENRALRTQLGAQATVTLIGDSPRLRAALELLRQVAKHATPVHLSGETGTGKDLAARALHDASPRHDQPFVAFNCAGVPETLVQSALFGHTKGAFTGASEERKGLFELADGGTLLLDEVADLPAAAQASLLRVLQDGDVVPLGSSKPRKVEVRIVSATNKDLRAEVAAGRFREDLLYRLMGFEIQLPALRERATDIPLLANHFLARLSAAYNKTVNGFSPACLQVLEANAWPGNVRQLENEIGHAVIQVQDHGSIEVQHLSPQILAGAREGLAAQKERYQGMTLPDAVQSLETRLIQDALEHCNGVAAHAARELGVEPDTLRKKLRRLGLKAT